MMSRTSSLLFPLFLALPFVGMAQSETEPNDGYTQSNPVAYNTLMMGSTGACSPTNNSVDYFSFTPPAQGTMRIQTAMSNSGSTDLNVTISVRQNSTAVIATYVATAGANNGVMNNTFLFTCQGTGLYYLSIENPSGSVCTNYSFKYDIVAPEFANDLEPNYSYTQADTAEAGMDHDGHLAFFYDDNDDYYRIVLPSDGILNIQWQAEHASASTTDSITVNLRATSTAILKSWKVGIGANSNHVSQMVSMTCRGHEQFYYMDVVSPTACGVSYRFNYNVTPPVFADDVEPNYAYTQADTAEAGIYHDGRLDFYYDDNDDYYRIVLPSDGILNMQWQAEHASASATDSITVNLRASSTSILKTWKVGIGPNSTPASQTVSMTCRGIEQFYFMDVVSPTACGVSYRFNYNVTPPVFADDVEPNFAYTQADTAEAGMGHDGRLDFYYDDNDDYYRIVLPTDGILNMQWQAEHASASDADSITVNLRANSTSIIKTWKVGIGANSTPASQTVSMTCRGNEAFYYMDVVSPTACGVSYRFNYNLTPPLFADDVEPNSSYSQATAIVLDSASAPGRLDFYYDNNDDYFWINHTGGPIVLHTQAENAGPAGTMQVNIRAASTAILETATIPVGGGSVPVSNTYTSAPYAAGVYYIEAANPTVCGVSYSFDCYDDDNDGTCNYFDLCPGGPEPGTPCNDGSVCTTGDVIDANCTCVGTPVLVDDGDPCTLDACDAIAGVTHIFQDADGDGTCDANDLCPGGPEPGTTCDDGNSATINDVIGSNCQCAGTLLGNDCEGVPGGPAVPGTACNDNDACTTGDVYDANCQCAGTFADADGDGTCDANDQCPGGPEPGTTCDDGNSATINDVIGSNCQCAGTLLGNDCEGVPGGPAQPGSACNDNDACTTGDVYDANCQCAGTFADADGDGTCDANDLCGNGPEPGSTCDDGDANTTNDMVDANCTCTGIPVNPCNEEKLVITFTLDDFGSQTTWELRSGNDQSVVAIGGPYADGQAGTTVMETVCVPSDCYRLRVMDSNGDGMGQGGYVVRDGTGNRLIDANGDFGAMSYLGYKFCLPVGTVELLPGSCDLENVTGNDNVQCTPLAGATMYDFQFFDPHTNYHPHFLRTQPMLGPAPMANIPPGLDLNLRVRAKVAGTFTPYGPACRISTAGNAQLRQNAANIRQATKGEFQAWPNPNNGERISISLTGIDPEVRTADVTLYDATGRQVLSATLPMDQGSLGTVLDLGNTVSGVYMVRITAGGTINESRILVVND